MNLMASHLLRMWYLLCCTCEYLPVCVALLWSFTTF